MNISIYDHENGNVPVFFRQMWKMQYGSDPYGNKLESGRLVVRMQASVITALTFVFIAVAGWTVESLQAPLLLRIFLSVVAFVAIVVMCGFLVKENKFNEHHVAYYQGIDELFNVFSIKPNAEIGGMSQEQFRQAIEDELKNVAGTLDGCNGFTKVSAKKNWHQMHNSALKWGLCDPEYDKYFPAKKKS